MLSKSLQEAAGNSTQPVYVEDVFSTYTYTGNVSSPRNIVNNIDLATKGGLVWIKSRTYGDTNYGRHVLSHDATTFLTSNSAVAAASSTGRITAFNSDGFTLGNSESVNDSAPNTYASWTFRKQPKFFDIQTFVSNSSYSATINHNLQSVPGCVIIKNTSVNNGEGWYVYHRSIGDSYHLVLNTTAAKAADSPPWITVSSTQISFNYSLSGVGQNYVAYIFAHDAGGFGLTGTDNVITCGSAVTNGSGALSVTLGYEPQWIMVKNSTSAGGWYMVDAMRGFLASPATTSQYLSADGSHAEGPWGGVVEPTATGFNISNGLGGASQTIIYIAIRRGPMKVPTDATKVFKSVARTGTGAVATVTGVGFAPDFLLCEGRQNYNGTYFVDKLRGNSAYLNATTNNAELTSTNSVTSFNMDGVTLGADTTYGFVNYTNYPDRINYFFRRAPSYFDSVCYTGTGAGSSQVITHNLTVTPELIFIKGRTNAYSWCTYSKTTAPNELNLDQTFAAYGAGAFANTSPTSTQFTVTSNASNQTSQSYVAYLFATCAGVSKVGSYTGNGSSQTINCGFTGGARFILIKRTDSTGDWYVWDTARGIVSGNDPHLSLNTTSAEVTSDDTIDTDSSGFIVNQVSATNVNVSSATYIFLAIA